MQTLRIIATADWGPALHRAARITAAFALLVFVIAADLVVLTYRAGKATGEALAQRSDQLAALFVALLASQPAAASSPAPARHQAATPVASRPVQLRPTAPHLRALRMEAERLEGMTQPHLRALRMEAERLEGMTQRQLMALAGTRRKLSKPQLLAMLSAA